MSTMKHTRRIAAAAVLGASALGTVASSAHAATPAATDTSQTATMQAPAFVSQDGATARITTAAPSREANGAFAVSTTAGTNLVGVHELHNARTGDTIYVLEAVNEYKTAVSQYGYTDNGVKFYAARTMGAGMVPVYRLADKSGHHLFTADKSVRDKDVAAGYKEGFAAFYADPAAPTHGSLPIGRAVYPAPSTAIHVSTKGSDSNAGTAASPVATIAHAIAIAPAGGTVVVHAGTYHEALDYVGKSITIQNAPGEAVWMDGSQQVTSWSQSGSTWTTPYAYNFDSGHTFTKGAPEASAKAWRFVNDAHPMAANPDQVWVDGTAQQQVASASQVKAGTFYVDAGAKKLVLGTNPAGHTVKVSTLQQAVRFGGDHSVLRGIGVRGYAPSQYMMGAVVSYATNTTFENDELDDSSTVNLGIYRGGDVVRHVTAQRAGMTNVLGTNADNLVVDHSALRVSNTEKFNFAPAAAGIKVGRTKGFTVSNSEVSGAYSSGLWTDEDVRDIVINHDDFTGNARDAVMLELSARARIVDNVMVGNGTAGQDSVFISDTSRATVWGNTIKGPRAAVRLGQDDRTRANQPNVGDKRSAPDADMTWHTTGAVVVDNVLENDGAANVDLPEGRGHLVNYGVVHGQMYSGPQLQQVAREDGNLFVRPNESLPQFVEVYQPANAAARTFTTWPALRAGVPSNNAHSAYTKTSVVSGSGAVASGATKAVTGQQAGGDVSGLGGSSRVGASS